MYDLPGQLYATASNLSRRRIVNGAELLNQLSFSSRHSMEGRELYVDSRGTSICEREDVDDDTAMSQSLSLPPEGTAEADAEEFLDDSRQTVD